MLVRVAAGRYSGKEGRITEVYNFLGSNFYRLDAVDGGIYGDGPLKGQAVGFREDYLLNLEPFQNETDG